MIILVSMVVMWILALGLGVMVGLVFVGFELARKVAGA